MPDFLWHDGLYFQSLRTRTLGIGENMQLGDVETVDKLGRLVEKRIGLSAHTDNEVDSDESVGHDLFDMFDTSREELRVVASAHKAENLIATRLQGYVEVGGEMFRCGDEIDNFVGQ